jgi:hypothetical protein
MFSCPSFKIILGTANENTPWKIFIRIKINEITWGSYLSTANFVLGFFEIGSQKRRLRTTILLIFAS